VTIEIGMSAEPSRHRFGDDGSVTILGSRSDLTGELFRPRRLHCPITCGPVSDGELAATGTVWAWAWAWARTYVHTPWAGEVLPGPENGYAAGLIDLED